MDVSMIAELSMQNELLKEALGKMSRPSMRRELGATAVTQRGMSVSLACRTFGVSETCYRYTPKLDQENDRIADLLVGLRQARRS
jgi:putative transposase